MMRIDEAKRESSTWREIGRRLDGSYGGWESVDGVKATLRVVGFRASAVAKGWEG